MNRLLYLSWYTFESSMPRWYASSKDRQSLASIACASGTKRSLTNVAISSRYFGRAADAVLRIFSDSFSS